MNINQRVDSGKKLSAGGANICCTTSSASTIGTFRCKFTGHHLKSSIWPRHFKYIPNMCPSLACGLHVLGMYWMSTSSSRWNHLAPASRWAICNTVRSLSYNSDCSCSRGSSVGLLKRTPVFFAENLDPLKYEYIRDGSLPHHQSPPTIFMTGSCSSTQILSEIFSLQKILLALCSMFHEMLQHWTDPSRTHYLQCSKTLLFLVSFLCTWYGLRLQIRDSAAGKDGLVLPVNLGMHGRPIRIFNAISEEILLLQLDVRVFEPVLLALSACVIHDCSYDVSSR